VDAGSLADWVAAVGTMLALVWALFLYRRNIREREERAARQVYPLDHGSGNVQPDEPAEFAPEVFDIFVHDDVEHGGYLIRSAAHGNPMRSTIVPKQVTLVYTAAIVNGSDEPITTVNFEIATLGGATVKSFTYDRVQIVLPGETKAVVLLLPHFKDRAGSSVLMLGLTVAVRFTDSSGRRWRRVVGWPTESVENEWYNGRRPRTFRRDVGRFRRKAAVRVKKIGRYFWPAKLNQK
jgi:hypothetical protein